jgi:nitrogen fixation/metabolism regulation signal transduction histidine kinase
LLGTAAAAAGIAWGGAALGLAWWLAVPLAVGLAGVASAAWLAHWLGHIGSLFRALEGTVSSYRDGDYAFSIAWPHADELQPLVQAHNQLGQALREQRLQLVQRELLLDTMLQQTPVAMLLADASARVVFANLAARHLLGQGRRLEGLSLPALQAGLPAALAEALGDVSTAGPEGLLTVAAQPDAAAPGGAAEAEDETYLLSQRSLVLGGQPHRLLLLRRLTQELRRQEVQSWKKLIRVISHEMNNSLAPIASLAYSGGELLRRGRSEALPELLATIEERARHLDHFIRGYAQFAKLPSPQLAPVAWPVLLQRLQVQQVFELLGVADVEAAEAVLLDPAQIEQALINLLRNAHESGSPPDAVAVQLRRVLADGAVHWCVDVLDRGPGMSDAVLAQALTPFYSTKRQGTGLGLALAREITEAHGGRLLLQRRDGGGLCVSMRLPARPAGAAGAFTPPASAQTSPAP